MLGAVHEADLCLADSGAPGEVLADATVGDAGLGHAVGRLARALRVVVEEAVVDHIQAVGAGDSREAGVVGERGRFVLGPVGVDELGHFPFEGVEGIGGRRYARRAEDDQPEAQARTLHGTLLNVDPAASRHL